MSDITADPRVEYLQNYCKLALNVKPEKFSRCISIEQNQSMMMDFFTEKSIRMLIITTSAAQPDTPVFMHKWSDLNKRKAIYLIKRSKCDDIPSSNFKSLLLRGDVSSEFLSHLYSFVNDICIPLLSNRKNTDSWPKLLLDDLMKQIVRCKNKVFVASGHVKGVTLLPLPPGIEKIKSVEDDDDKDLMFDRQVIYSIETVIIDWTHQINLILSQSSDEPSIHPKSASPFLEIAFWKKRAKNLLNIFDQMKDPRIKRMAEMLEKSKSSYHVAFKNVVRQNMIALYEAHEINRYLSPLSFIFEDIQNNDYELVKKRLEPMLNLICLLWVKCRYYRNHTRIVTLLQEICGLLNATTRSFLDSSSLMQMEPEDGLFKILEAMETMQHYRNVFAELSAGIPAMFPENDTGVKTWDFTPELVFSEFDNLYERLKSIKFIFTNAVEYDKLEKFEMGGLKGKLLSNQLAAIREEFTTVFKEIGEGKFDCLDLNDKRFDQSLSLFNKNLMDLDRRLSAVACEAVTDSTSIIAIKKISECFGTFLERPLVKADFQSNYKSIIKYMDEILAEGKQLLDRQRTLLASDVHAVHRNMPAISGQLKWAEELRQRISVPYTQLTLIDHPSLKNQDAKFVLKKYDEMMEHLDEFQNSIYSNWAKNVEEKINFNLQKSLICRDETTQLIDVNFNPQLLAVLREMKYLNLIHPEGLPSKAKELYKSCNVYIKYTQNLDLAVQRYNIIRETAQPVEFSLISEDLTTIDNNLKKAEERFNWNSDVMDYIKTIGDDINDLRKRMQSSKENLIRMTEIMSKWTKAPLFDRRDGKHELTLDLTNRVDRCNVRYEQIRKDGEKLHELLTENKGYFKANDDMEDWTSYILHVDDFVVEGFINCIMTSLNFLLDNTDTSNPDNFPLFEVKMSLFAAEITFKPGLEGEEDCLLDIVEGVVQDIFKSASFVKRVSASRNLDHYQYDMEDMLDLMDPKNELLERITAGTAKAIELRNNLENYSYLWVDERSEYMRQFLAYGRPIGIDETEPINETPPTLDQFRQNIDSYEATRIEVAELENALVFDTWLRVDCRPFKHALLAEIDKWSNMFKQHLLNYVTNSLADLETFTVEATKELQIPLEEGDYNALVTTMDKLKQVRERIQITDKMFEPIKQTIDLLNSYGQEVSESTLVLLQSLPEKWINVKKLAITTRQNVMPLQTEQVARLRKKCADFEVKQLNFRKEFRCSTLFSYDNEDPYTMLDQEHLKIQAMEMEMKELSESATLFEVNVPDYKHLRQCRKEVKMLKTMWDLIFYIKISFDLWTKTLWADIDVENMDLECKKHTRDLRILDKEIKQWDCYLGLEKDVNNLITSLRSVSSLQNPAIRERHWSELMQTTSVRIVMSDDTTLHDLLELKLHKYEEEVNSIVDKAVKEGIMEKTISELNTIWKDSNMKFTYMEHMRTGINILKTDEDLIEKLEEHQQQLQSMITSKYIAHFLTEVSSWQKKLSIADSVITVLLEVQRTWSHLESIFIGSEDIRKQLPEDSNRFDRIDEEFKSLMKLLEKTPNVIDSTNQPHLLERFESLQERLALCEKALDEYLETKRLAFPRFYFVSAADLLAILSNGNEPLKVVCHLSKLFDSTSDLEFINGTKTAVAMFSKDGEKVQLYEECDCGGQVEVWLTRVEQTMRQTLKYKKADSLVAYEEKPRDQWLFDWPAQPALICTQIWWTNEVEVAFGRLEEGYENALKEYNRKQIMQLNALITLLIGQLSSGDRQKIMTICTIDVHSRDVVHKLITQRVESANEFIWLSQLRHKFREQDKIVYANICDASFDYCYEYLGNTPRLVITPLTDRCYTTLTQSLHLIMGGAPAGPAGTGKTETTKDLGRALGMMVYVFNCSEQMNYKSCGNIYKGLAQTGAWGCFDEFNRISVEVLSVVAVQVKSVLDAIKDKRSMFNFMGEEIRMVPSVGMFITMNPGYAGRTELPENLKTLFRPCAMVVPDFALISEIMLVAEAFTEAKILSRRFITLYKLCKELLSKQDHYDWGLRAIKSVLVVAGALRRGDPDRPEDEVLMRALRDFNVPKIVSDDTPIFLGLIGDLFPALDVPRKTDKAFEQLIKNTAVENRLQPEDNFILKVVQLQELIDVRHSVFVLGNAGTGKSQVLRTLHNTYKNKRLRPVFWDLNPKAVTNDELFGIINPATQEWKDGLFSVLMRDMANISGDSPKWIVLDGDIDPLWIESLNTVMDDNKILTLASNERIPLNPSMRLIFEISNLKTATPATVSRAGILYLNPTDVGWNPIVQSWTDSREIQSERANLTILFEKYVPPCLEILKHRFKKITPITETAHVQMLCNLLECMLTPDRTPSDCTKDIYEIYFVFTCVWAMGSGMYLDQVVDYRNEFTKWWTSEFKTVKFPSQGTVFDYYVDDETRKFEPWSKKISQFEFMSDMPIQRMLVETSETARIQFFMNILMNKRRPVMLVGNAGCGKTINMVTKLNSLNKEEYVVTNVSFNFYTTSEMLQQAMEKPLEKKAGKNFGPPGTKHLIYFIDDMNMPEVDQYFTVQPHTLLRQHMDYGHWYDRTKLVTKIVHNVQYVSCMNPTAGSFTINPRLQRHFAVFAVSFPVHDALQTIYNNILSSHFSYHNFNAQIKRISINIVNTMLVLHQRVTQTFLPTAIKFHYMFNLRELSNIIQGFLFTTPDCLKIPKDAARLFLHECRRVYRDKLIDEKDFQTYDKIESEVIYKNWEEVNMEDALRLPNIYCHFIGGDGEAKYMPIKSNSELTTVLVKQLQDYNDMVCAMNLVLFDDAMKHICRINRILNAPRGNALLVGVGGSGKQSLARLSAHIAGLMVFQIQLAKGYGMTELKNDLATLFIKVGCKNLGAMFLMTDAQVASERFLVVINDLLSGSDPIEMFTDEQIEMVNTSMQSEVKEQGLQNTNENCWQCFVEKVRCNLKIVLCFSPVGSLLRIRARRFPVIINATSIDWFHEWPKDALISVSNRFLKEVSLLDDDKEVRRSAADYMAFVHGSVNEKSIAYLQNERRYNYTTPKSFLEFIKLYQNLLLKKHEELKSKKERLENGLIRLESTSAQVDALKEQLAGQEVELAKRNENADKLIQKVGTESQKVEKEKAIANEEEKKVQVIATDVSAKQRSCEEDLKKAEPALVEAQAALNTLDKANLTELKSFGSPPTAVVNVTAAVMVLYFGFNGRVPKDRSWKAAKVMMGKVDEFLNNLKKYDKDHIHDQAIKSMQEYLNNPDFNPEFIKSKSVSAAGLCSWCINIVKYHYVYKEVEPKRIALAQSNEELAAAREKLQTIQDKIAVLNQNLKKLTKEFQNAVDAKQKCQDEADATANTISLANRMVQGLASEKIRWANTIEDFNSQARTLPGDMLLVAASISYLGCFSKEYRKQLLNEWFTMIKKMPTPIPIRDNFDPLRELTDDAQIAQWNNQGLPTDKMSTENAVIFSNSERWPLLIDPQLQAIKWIKPKYGEQLKIIRLQQKGYLDVMEKALCNGHTVLIENLMEEIDPILEPVLGRTTIKKGTAMKLGDNEIDYNKNFKLILHTKLQNPHYKPEIQAQTTLINFTVTPDGLEDQLLATVVNAERPDLESKKMELTKQQNQFTITLKELEDNLLHRLSTAEGNFLGDTALVENLETTKRTASDIEIQVEEAAITGAKINEARELYRPAATRASILYFILNDLNKINQIYQFSLEAFNVIFCTAIGLAGEPDPEEEVKQRVETLIDLITFQVYNYTARGLFEKDKLIFKSQMVFQILLNSGEIKRKEVDFLLKMPRVNVSGSPVDFLTTGAWGIIKALSGMEEFRNLDRDIEGSAKRWKKFVECETIEKEKLPQDWKNKTTLQKLCILRALRPDRMTYAIEIFLEEKLGKKYVEGRSIPFSESYKECSPSTPVFFILSPGVDPLLNVEALGKKLGFTFENETLHNISLGQGQEIVAENALSLAHQKGHWVILQNIHLVAKWLPVLDKKLEELCIGSHEDYRVFMSAEPPPPESSVTIPQGLLENSLKITNEPPSGMFANLHKALDNFTQESLEVCTKEVEYKAILFSLCYFHAVIAERRKFGPQGWNRNYPFNNGDLTISAAVLLNYLEANNKVPWEDLRYLFGEIMYGGHITDDWDRRLCNTYLEAYMDPDLIDSHLHLAPGFLAPPNLDFNGYHRYIDENLPSESPNLYGLHPNAEIGFLTAKAEVLFETILRLQPQESSSSDDAGGTREEKIKETLEKIVEDLPEQFNMIELTSRIEDATPYTVVCIQECEIMNSLLNEIKVSLHELDLGLKGELTITSKMEDLSNALLMERVPTTWNRYPSTNGLSAWYQDLLQRCSELNSWSSDFSIPSSVWIGGLFNPQSFLTAIMQQTARKNEWSLDKISLSCDVTKRVKEEVTAPPREGAFVCGLFIEGARWDVQTGSLAEAKLKELTPQMPIVYLKAIPSDKPEKSQVYECPVYKTKNRGPTFVWAFNLKTKEAPSRWIIEGVALLLSV